MLLHEMNELSYTKMLLTGSALVTHKNLFSWLIQDDKQSILREIMQRVSDNACFCP